MLISIVIDPKAFNYNYFKLKESNILNAKIILDGVLSNGVILMDSEDGVINKELNNNIMELCNKGEIYFTTKWAEILKNRNKHIVFLPNSLKAEDFNTSIENITKILKPDGIIVEEKDQKINQFSNIDKSLFILLSDYYESEVEQRRKYYYQNLDTLDRIDTDEIKSLFISFLRYSKYLKFYDKYLGRANENDFSQYEKSISYIIDIWINEGILFSHFQPSVEIITCCGNFRRDKTLRPTIENKLLVPLRKKYSIHIGLVIKEDQRSEMHARFLKTNNILLSFDRGFDLFNNSGKFKKNILKIESNCESYIQHWSNLNNI